MKSSYLERAGSVQLCKVDSKTAPLQHRLALLAFGHFSQQRGSSNTRANGSNWVSGLKRRQKTAGLICSIGQTLRSSRLRLPSGMLWRLTGCILSSFNQVVFNIV